jgi:hypothetical protein
VHAKEQDRDGNEESGDRTGDADVEQRRLGRDRLTDSDDRSRRSGPDTANENRWRQRKKIGERRIDTVIAAGEIVAELVSAEDGDDARAVPECVRDQPRRAQVERDPAKVAEKTCVRARASGGRGEGCQSKQHEITAF